MQQTSHPGAASVLAGIPVPATDGLTGMSAVHVKPAEAAEQAGRKSPGNSESHPVRRGIYAAAEKAGEPEQFSP